MEQPNENMMNILGKETRENENQNNSFGQPFNPFANGYQNSTTNSNINNNNNQNENENLMSIPDDIKEIVSHRSNRNEKSRFPHRLFTLLKWAGNNEERGKIAGCGWISKDVFFLDKAMICKNMEIKMNTLNVNLKTLGFVKSGKRNKNLTYYSCNQFTNESKEEDFEKIRKTTIHDSIMYKAILMPLLEDLELYKMTLDECLTFKKHVIKVWESIVGNVLFAVGIGDFIDLLESKLKDFIFKEMPSIKQALSPRNSGVIDIFDFAVFLARFGPFEHSTLKLYQYTSVAQGELRPDLLYAGAPSFTKYYGPNFHNCFSFRSPQAGEYHCYNLPLKNSDEEFLIDEDGLSFASWQKLVQMNQFLVNTKM